MTQTEIAAQIEALTGHRSPALDDLIEELTRAAKVEQTASIITDLADFGETEAVEIIRTNYR